MANGEKLKVVSIDKLSEYDPLLKNWVTNEIETMSINAVVSSTEPIDQHENDIWLKEYT